jgi:hypothetical protein
VPRHLHSAGKRGDKILDEYLTTVCLLRADKLGCHDAFVSDVDMLDVFLV